MVPLGLAYLAACAERAGHDVLVIDCNALSLDINKLQSRLREMDFHLAGISVMTPMALTAYRIAALIKAMKPEVNVVLGGPHVSALPLESLNECPEADYIIVGEGEQSFISLLSSLGQNSCRQNVPGLVYRDNGTIRRTHDAGHMSNLDEIPQPAYHLFPMNLYRPPVTKYRRLPTFSIISSRGCPFNCSFCGNSVHGKKLRQRSIANVMQELYYLRDNFGAKGIVFQDSSLCQNKKWVYELCEAMLASGIDLEWSCLARVEQVDLELLTRMKEAGCWQISYGIESGNQKTLDSLRKNNTLAQIEAAVAAAHKAGVQVRATYMLAVPGETRKDILNTIKFAKKLGTMFASFQLTVPLPGTLLYEESHGIRGFNTQPICWDDYNFFNKEMPFYIPEGMSREELKSLCEKAWISYYLSLRVILRHVISIRSVADIRKYIAGIVGLAKMVSSKYLSWTRAQ